MVAHHKSLPDGTGYGMGWILANSISKAQFVMQRQQGFARLYQQQQPYQPQQHTRPIPTLNNTNYCSILYDEEDDEEDKTIIHGKCKYNITACTDPLTDESSVESIESPKQ